jgi:hypothetical protein
MLGAAELCLWAPSSRVLRKAPPPQPHALHLPLPLRCPWYCSVLIETDSLRKHKQNIVDFEPGA